MKLFGSRLAKKILGIILIMGCSSIFFNGYVGVNEVHAQVVNNQGVSGPWAISENTPAQNNGTDTNTENNITTMGLWEILNLILKLIYILLRPLLVIAGISLDNTLVYASIFHMDAPLRKFRNMMKNFANFTLGFMVLYAIIKSLLTGGGEGSLKEEGSPLNTIKKTLIAGVLIQASRFLMAALVDISTIATYAIGGLPLTVLKNTDIGNQKILSVNSQIDLNKFDVLNKDNTSFKVRYSTNYGGQVIKMSPCLVKKSFIIGREFGEPDFRNIEKFSNDSVYKGYEVCVLFGNQLVMWREDDFMNAIDQHIGSSITGWQTPDWKTNAGYKSMIDTLLNYSGWDTQGWVTGLLVNLKNGTGGLSTGSMFFDQTTSTTISQLIDKSKGFVGPLVTMYSSLLNFAQLTDTNVSTLGETSGIFLIKTGLAIALFFPLIALAIVLIARIGLLWLYIAASPFLVLKKVFDKLIPEKALGNMSKHLEIGNVIKLIFAPVVTVAALSISLIFMTALINGFKGDNNSGISEQVAKSFQIEPIKPIQTGNTAFRVAGSSELEFKDFDRGGTLDRFSRLVVNFFAIGLIRTILFAAIKANALGDFIQKNIQEFGSNVFQTLPILPFGEGGEKVGIGPARTVLQNRPAERVRERETEQLGKVEAIFKKSPTPPEFTDEQAKNILNAVGTGSTPQVTAEEAYKTAGISAPTTFSDAGTKANLEVMYKAIQQLEEPQRMNAAANVAPVFGLTGASWYTDLKKAETLENAKKAIDTDITQKNITNKEDLTNYFNDASNDNKTHIETYFTTAGTGGSYETTIGNKKYKITQTTDTQNQKKFKYKVEEITS